MARVPTLTGGLVERRADPQLIRQAADFGEGGRAIGAAVQRLGGQLVDQAEAQDRLDAQLDEAGAKKLDVEYSNWSRAALYTGDDAFYTKEGFAAADARPGLEKSIDEQRQALLAKATTPRMRQMLTDALERRASADLEGIGRHANTQLRTEEKRQSAARMAAASDDAVTYADDPERFDTELQVGLSEVRTEAARSGAGGETLKRAEDEFKSTVYSRVAQARIDRGDIEGASAWLEANRSQLLPEQAQDLDRALRAPILERQADGIVDDLLGIAPDDIAPQVTTARAASGGNEGNVLARMTQITAVSESRNRERDAQGRLITSPKGAQGKMQVMPGTNADPGYGVRAARDGSDAERTRVGRDYLAAMMREYGNDPAKAWAAYNWGPGNLDNAIKQHGANWLAHAPDETKKYVRGNLAALGGRGGAEAVQQAPREHDMTALLAQVDKLNLPYELEQKVRRQLSERVGLDEQLLNRQREQAQERALSILDAGEAAGRPVTRESQIPQSVWSAMSPSQRMSVRGVIERNASPAARTTDYTAYTQLSDLYAKDPAAFAKLDPMSFRNSLSASDYEQVMGWRRDALGSAAKAGRGEGQVTHSRIRSVITNAVQGAGLTYAGLRTRDKAGRAAVDKRVYQLETAISRDVQIWQRANPGKEISDLEISQIADRQLVRWKPMEGEFDDDNPRFWFERTAGRGQIIMPRSDRDRLVRQGRAILGRDPTSAEITAAYLAEARGGR